ncbi:glycine cleavage system aminomethyltransferase GcvT [bacterium]|nr:glycine cleavage system aminomethyltransferase GcvT [bacterium]
MSDETGLKKTPLHSLHVQLGAKMVPFAGWHMPVQYEGIIQEHKAVRSAAGLFDVSHMGEIDFRGPDAFSNVQNLVTNNVARLEVGNVLYSGMLYHEGTFVDDLLVYKLAEDHYWLVVNASNTDKDFQWIKDNQHGDVSIENISDTICQIALQGPRSFDLASQLTSTPIRELGSFCFVEGEIAGCRGLLSRTGYTGEDGLEIYVAWNDGPQVWSALIETGRPFGLKPIGLGARDTLRLEAGLPLYGNDISDRSTPIEAGLKWTVKLKKGDFIGRDVLVKQNTEGVGVKLVGFVMIDKGIPRPHYPVWVQGRKVAEVASGGMGIWLDKMIGTAYVPIEYTQPGTEIEIEIRNKRLRAEVITLPFYKRPVSDK